MFDVCLNMVCSFAIHLQDDAVQEIAGPLRVLQEEKEEAEETQEHYRRRRAARSRTCRTAVVEEELGSITIVQEQVCTK
jgi:ATPase subunit of ABC transporter with duplicated ATPase domains